MQRCWIGLHTAHQLRVELSKGGSRNSSLLDLALGRGDDLFVVCGLLNTISLRVPCGSAALPVVFLAPLSKAAHAASTARVKQ